MVIRDCRIAPVKLKPNVVFAGNSSRYKTLVYSHSNGYIKPSLIYVEYKIRLEYPRKPLRIDVLCASVTQAIMETTPYRCQIYYD